MLIATVVGADVAVIALRGRATPVPYDVALSRYRDAVTMDEPPISALGDSSLQPDPTGSGEPELVGPQPVPTVAERDGLVDAPAPKATESADPRPLGGVYRYRTDGSEEVPLINARRSYAPTTPVTVLRRDGCHWSMRVDFLAEHRDEYELCSAEGAVAITAVRIAIRWFGIEQTMAFTCTPPVPLITNDDTGPRQAVCSSSDTASEMLLSPRPPETITVGNQVVEAARLDWMQRLSGRFEGSASYQLWLEPSTGLPLKVVRHVDAQGATPLGRQRYVENHTSTLTHLAPDT